MQQNKYPHYLLKRNTLSMIDEQKPMSKWGRKVEENQELQQRASKKKSPFLFLSQNAHPCSALPCLQFKSAKKKP
jgi:hypothetical protein